MLRNAVEYIVLVILLSNSIAAFAQQKRLICYDLFAKTIDTLSLFQYDENLEENNTVFSLGTVANQFANLQDTPPIGDECVPNTSFSYKSRTLDQFDLNDFPISTSIKLFRQSGDTLLQTCSGSMISPSHVLTAAHCNFTTGKDSMHSDSFYVAPVYNNGVENPNFGGSWVHKIYKFENWHRSFLDIILLELEEPLGEKTGWLGYGYNNNDDELLDGMYHKFSYPGKTLLMLDSAEYNGDTLYHGYGKIDLISEYSFGVEKYTGGIPGESGSSIIHTENQEKYTTYGVLSYSSGYRHTRINGDIFHAFEAVIVASRYTKISRLMNAEISIYPNPTTDFIYFAKLNQGALVRVYNLQGVLVKECIVVNEKLNIIDLAKGSYLLVLHIDKQQYPYKIIKN